MFIIKYCTCIILGMLLSITTAKIWEVPANGGLLVGVLFLIYTISLFVLTYKK
jgi:hypothetical protein